jgi:hypothetical protein
MVLNYFSGDSSNIIIFCEAVVADEALSVLPLIIVKR